MLRSVLCGMMRVKDLWLFQKNEYLVSEADYSLKMLIYNALSVFSVKSVVLKLTLFLWDGSELSPNQNGCDGNHGGKEGDVFFVFSGKASESYQLLQ